MTKMEKMMEKEIEMERYLDLRIHTPCLCTKQLFTGEKRELRSSKILFINNCLTKILMVVYIGKYITYF